MKTAPFSVGASTWDARSHKSSLQVSRISPAGSPRASPYKGSTFFSMSRIDQGIEGQEGAYFADDHDDAHGDGRMVAGDADDWSHDGAADHGEETDEGRCTAGIASLVLHGHGETAGTHHGQRRYGQEENDHDDRQRHAGTEGCQQGHAADSGQTQGKPKEFPVSNAACQPARNGTVDHEADTIDAKDEAESLS